MNDFHAIKAPDDIARLVATNARLDMVTVKCFCSQQYGKYISCFVDAGNRTAPFLARALGGDVLGGAIVSFVIAIPPDFFCDQRDGNQLVKGGKCLCRRGYSQVNSKLAP
ncbi:MAG: hypothetical protein HYY97_02755 [Rhodocyclales bacterium]|nr:hypothetical protein [Rhodocyclales bacterium]